MSINHVAVTNWGSTHDLDIQFAVEAARKELPEFSTAWGVPIPGIQFYSRDVELPAREAMIVSAVDSDGQVGTLGYHTTVAGLPLFLWESAQGAWIFAHELWETLANPFVDRYELAPDGSRWMVEACDATQGDTYPVDVEVMGNFSSVMVANWLRPSFFGLPNPDGSPLFDKMGVVKEPFTLRPGGYSIVRDVSGNRTQIGAARPNKGCSTSRTQLAPF